MCEVIEKRFDTTDGYTVITLMDDGGMQVMGYVPDGRLSHNLYLDKDDVESIVKMHMDTREPNDGSIAELESSQRPAGCIVVMPERLKRLIGFGFERHISGIEECNNCPAWESCEDVGNCEDTLINHIITTLTAEAQAGKVEGEEDKC